MLRKPLGECDEAELRAIVASAGPEVAEAKQSAQIALDRLKLALWAQRRAGAELLNRFAVDPKTGKRLRKVPQLALKL